jgi:proton-dependent oligopeptide transporter, POT family
MAATRYQTTPPETDRMPPGVPYIVGNEAAERFSFYGMKAVLAVFMTDYLVNAAGEPDVMSKADATRWIHNFVTAAYCFPLLGAILSDWLFGKYRIIIGLSLVYCLGHAILGLMDLPTGLDQRTLLFWGLALIALGSGGIKPCVSAHVGDQFGRKNAFLLTVVFGWFYFSINFGSTASTLLTPVLMNHPDLGPAWAFGVPGVLMAVATLVFWMGRHKFVHVPPSGKRFFRETFSPAGLRAMKHLVPLFLFVAMFWSLFDQSASRWVLQAKHMDRNLLGISLTPDQVQAANPILVMLLIPLFSYGLYPFLNRFFHLTPLRKIGIGMFLVLPSFAIPAWLETRITYDQTHVSPGASAEATRIEDEELRRFIHARCDSSAIARIDIDRTLSPVGIEVHAVRPERIEGIDGERIESLREALAERFETPLRLSVIETAAPGIGWQLLAYLFLTAAEVMISITCLEFAYTQAPNRMKSYIMSLYLLFSVAVGNQFTATVNAYIQSQEAAGRLLLQGADYYWFFTGCMAATAVLYVLWSRTYRGETYLQSESKREN